ncbi:MAG: general secretion pathway protein GspB [Aliivibrio sp.]|uniref:general secretion pathway protein GspB n=1 Tax=Aliivibrio sp. TaxID=1872443 RepID=UPI001A56F449|nr:general secretion pathway protein GspB [Aliivibrio sp.]
MSNILNALHQSEQQFKKQQSVESRSGSYQYSEERRVVNLYFLFSLLVCIPAAVVMIIAVIINPEPAKQFSAKLLSFGAERALPQMTAVTPQTPVAITEERSGLVILEYPSFDTQRMPETESFANSNDLPLDNTLVVQSDKPQQPDESEIDLNRLDMSELSPEIVARLKSIMQNQPQGSDSTMRSDSIDNIEQQSIALPRNSSTFMGSLPALNFQTHIYSSQAKKRWVKVNGVEVKEGDDITLGVRLEEIKPREVLVSFDGQLISIPSLYEWSG